MCWKQEWAAAIGNIAPAIVHVERAKAKLEKRKASRETTIERLNANPSKLARHPELMKCALERQLKMEQGIKLCNTVIDILKIEQEELKKMIDVFGISKVTEARRTKQLMEGKQAKRMKKSRKWEGRAI